MKRLVSEFSSCMSEQILPEIDFFIDSPIAVYAIGVHFFFYFCERK
jgi:hypothetical protein